MGTDLNAPLGQNRKTRSSKAEKSGLTFGRLSLGVCALALIGVSVWTILKPTGLILPPEPQIVADAAQPGEKAATEPDSTKLKQQKTSGGLSGAHVEETLTDNGSIVTRRQPSSSGQFQIW